MRGLTNNSLDNFIDVVIFVVPLCDFIVSLEQGVAVNTEILDIQVNYLLGRDIRSWSCKTILYS